MVDLIQERYECDVDHALKYLKESNNKQGEYYEMRLRDIKKSLPEYDEKEFDQADFQEMLELFPEDDYFDMLIHVLEKSNLGGYQYRFLREFLDSVCMKNSSSMLLADSRRSAGRWLPNKVIIYRRTCRQDSKSVWTNHQWHGRRKICRCRCRNQCRLLSEYECI